MVEPIDLVQQALITLPGAWLENIIRIAFDAARRKAMEE